ncbi:GntR family transcriptional regulator [Ramlibacter sp.]|uniref:GntR family transcriptional regulator n=1 Tax=Ramlibacter sp. TaxID=1917967 RepID=UPI003D0F0EE1
MPLATVPAWPAAAGQSAPWGPRAGIPRGAESRTLAGRTAQRIREDIVRNRLAPGERLTNEKLAARYEVGTSPLREALFQVAGDGLVRIEDHKGFVVAPIELAEMWDVSSLRAYLEINAMRRSIALGGEAWEAAVLTADHRLAKAERRLLDASAAQLADAEDEWERRHREFHFALCSACESPWLLYFFDTLYDQLERYRRHFWQYRERAGGADDQHRQIRDAALDRDAERATQLLTQHFERQAELSALSATQPAKAPRKKRAA